ncbi:MAG: dihydroorotate dehydrogenase [Candidatus Marinimicrobia bacterium]|nr:dihydroorotate dehydrogenase [Candidatus Neomarinimicrobiota bacterium]
MNKKEILKYLLNDEIKFATVSGIWTTKPNIIKLVDTEIPDIDIITTKSYQVKPNPGNREPIIAEKSVGNFVNAVGLRNPGMEIGYQELKQLRDSHKFNSLLNISISGNSPEEFIQLVKKFEDIADILELNFSCPHAKPGYGASIGVNPELVKIYVEKIRQQTNALIFPKLTPNVNDIGTIAKIAVDAGADGIVAINTVGPEKYIDPNIGEPILNNPNGNKGGASGENIFPIAIEKIKEIRKAIGNNIPIIGMGGITDAKDVRKMIEAGANIIGIGSVIARVHYKKRQKFIKNLKRDVNYNSNTSPKFVNQNRLAKYDKFKISKIEKITNDLRILTLSGKKQIEFKPSQYGFLWIPGVGEKPFSIVNNKPLTFLIRKRKFSENTDTGNFTHALFQLNVDDDISFRGSYGADVIYTKSNKVFILSGGTGIAVIPQLVKSLKNKGKEVFVFHGIKKRNEIILKNLIEKYAKFIPVVDDGKPGRVIDIMRKQLIKYDNENATCYNIGPEKLMKNAMKTEVDLGIKKENIFASLETNHMCGIGICGECECGGILGCQHGTFYDYLFLKENYELG